MADASLRIGVDVGGTFTDLTIIDERSARIHHFKGLSTQSDPAEGTLALIKASDVEIERVGIVVHGTTVVINTLVERTGARTGLVTTKGFRDILEIRHGGRTSVCTPFVQNPKPFISRELRQEVREAIWANGEVESPIDEMELDSVLDYLRQQGVTSVAVCFLNSYVNPIHELAVADAVARRFPGMYCSLSSEIASKIGEYERFSTTMLNAYVQPKTSVYLRSMQHRLKELGMPGELYVMQSSGGIVEANEAARKPVAIMESGPTGGVIASLMLGQAVGRDNLIAFDMGGTTSKAGIIQDGQAKVVSEFEFLGSAEKPGSGWPSVVPMMDIPEIGIGGGSIGWLSIEGFLHVGPQSAGADPGPICYRRGGSEPTLTDANAVLGVLDNLLDGVMPLDTTAALQDLEARIAKPLGITPVEGAHAIRDIAIAKSADLLREVTVARGLDPRDFTLVAYGGAGPMHACDLIAELGISEVIIPRSPGTFSALGLVYADLRSDFIATRITRMNDAKPEDLEAIFAGLEQRADAAFARQRFEGQIIRQRSLDLRYVGQVHEVTIQIDPVSGRNPTALADRLHEAHRRLYGHSFSEEPVEIVNFRLSALGLYRKPPLSSIAPQSHTVQPTSRSVYFHGLGSIPTKVFRRANLGAGFSESGPVIVEEYSSTTLVPPGHELQIDGYGNLWVRRT